MASSGYSYNGKLYRPCATVADENSFFHSAFGIRAAEGETYSDKHYKVKRMRWAAFLTYFENEEMPVVLADILIGCFSAKDAYKHKSIRDKNHFESYVRDITMAGQPVTKQEVPILSTLENIRIVLLSNEGPDPVVIVNPNVEILGNYSTVLEKSKDEVVLCLEENTFSRLEPVFESSASNSLRAIENKATREQLQQTDSSLRYKKGGSAGSEGVEFQVNLLMVLLLNSLRNLKDWKLSTENKEAGKLDDAVLELPESAFLIQAKHKGNANARITFDDLLSTNSKKDDFSLPKYFLSYQEVKNGFKGKNTIIICTNAGIDKTALEFLANRRICTESVLYCADENYSFHTFNLNILSSLKEKVGIYLEKNWQNKNIDRTVITDENLKDFLERLQFYFNYPLGSNTEKDTGKLVSLLKCSGNFCDQISTSEIYAKLMKWFQQKDGIYLTETTANAMLFEIKSDQYWQKLDKYGVSFQRNLLNVQDKKKVYYVSAEAGYLLQELRIHHSLRNNKSKILYASPEGGEFQKIIETFKVSRYTILVVSFCSKGIIEEFLIGGMWDKLRKILNQYEKKIVILLAERNKKLLGQIDLDRSFCDIIDGSVRFKDFSQDSQSKLLQRKVVFQGAEVSLEVLLENHIDRDYTNELSLEILEKLVREEQIKVGLEVYPLDEQVGRYYVDRTFKKEIKRSEEEEGVGMERIETISEEKIYTARHKVVVIADAAGMGKSTVLSRLAVTIKNKNPQLWVIRIDLSDYSGILKDFKERNKIIDVTELLDFRDTKLSNQLEEVLFSMKRKVVVLMDGVDEISPDYTELVIGLLVQCQQGANFDKVFVTTRPNMAQELESKLQVKSFTLLPFTERHQIRFLTEYWAHNLKLDSIDKKKCETYAYILLRTMSSWMNLHQEGEQIGAMPLQIRMLAEIFQTNDRSEESMDWEGCKEYLEGNGISKLPEKSNVAKIYEMFIEKKRNVFKIKGNPNGNTAANEALVDQFEECLACHRLLALEEILRKSECELFSHYQPVDRNVETKISKMGIVQISENRFYFVHRTFAEFFVGKSLLSELQLQVKHKNLNFQKFFFDEILLKKKFKVVRVFFDNFLKQIVHDLPPNIFESYRSLIYAIDLEATFRLIHSMAEEGCTAILRLLFKCIHFKVIGDKNIGFDHFKQHIFKCISSNVLIVLDVLVREGGVNICDEFNRTPLLSATQREHLEMVKFLVEQGANLNPIKPVVTPLWFAVRGSQFDVLKFMVLHGADLKIRDYHDYSILYNAISTSNVEKVEFLLDYTLQYNRWEEIGSIIPYTAAYLGQLNTLEGLIKEGLNIHVTVEKGETLILGAARGGQIETVKYLMRHDADINSTDEDGNTALHLIANRPAFVSTAKDLVELGIDVNVKNYRGDTALHLAISSLGMTEFLVKSGTDVNSRNQNGTTALCLAASCGQLETVKFLVEHASDINVTDNAGNTALHSAAGADLNTVKYLLRRGVDVNVKNNNGYLPLHSAALQGDSEIAKFLVLECGVDVNARDATGSTALYVALRGGQRYVIECLVELGAGVNIDNGLGFTALHLAASNGLLDIVKSLVDLGADINNKDASGHTSLHLSALNSRWQIVKFLMELDSNLDMGVNDREIVVNLASKVRNVLYPYGRGSLHEAAANGNLRIIKVLLKLGVNVDMVDHNGCTPLHVASSCLVTTVKFLVEHGADINIKDRRGGTALHHAVCTSQWDVIKFFLERGVNINITDNDGSTLLHYAARSGQWDIIEFFLNRGIDVNVRNIYGLVPIQFAVMSCSRFTLNALLERGADVNNRDDDGRTALHFAASGGNLDAVKFLVESGIDTSVRDNSGRTWLHFGALDTVNFILDLGIDVNVRDNDGRTPQHCAAEKGQLNKVEVLVMRGSELNIRDSHGRTALLLAAAANKWTVAEHLMRFAFDVNMKDNTGRTVLHFAALIGHLNMVERVVELGGDVNIQDDAGRTVLHLTALQDFSVALPIRGFCNTDDMVRTYWNIVKFLVEKGADIDTKDYAKDTAAMLAIRGGNYHLLQHLEPKNK
ncbi:uncharacterized protein LOC108909444 [Anoplophora glabripennis]|uniref:uncharacterized protein LOC108909444 n=1 Tax=Anoplophora glabripennis TaxID=217634 RepID=UPI000873A0D6|nr:uncharacterized protein LOC108909444 [Anoplophora glabripennis]